MDKKEVDDLWVSQKVGAPLPQNVQKAPGQANKYVALWVTGQKAIVGKAVNESGGAQCYFVDGNKIFTGADVGGQIFLLQSERNVQQNGQRKTFNYEWISYQQSKNYSPNDLVIHSKTTPCFLSSSELLGSLNLTTGVAHFVQDDGKLVESNALNNMFVLCRKLGTMSKEVFSDPIIQGQSFKEDKVKIEDKKLLTVNDWEDYNWGGPWPAHRPVMNVSNEQYVALWYRHGKPIMGRAWPVHGKIEALFVDANRQFTGSTVGSLQLLIRLPPTVTGYEYVWMAYEVAKDFHDKDYMPVHMSYVAPALFTIDGTNVLGSLDMKTEKAFAVHKNKIVQVEGGQVRSLQVLCRKEHGETFLV